LLDILLYDGFDEHAGDAEAYAKALEAAAQGDVPDKHLAQFAKVGVHTLGEHIGDWSRAQRLAGRLVAGRAATAETWKAWAHLHVARLLAGDAAGAAEAEVAAFTGAGADFRPAAVETKFLLVAALVGIGRADAAAAIYGGALGLARTLGETAPARAIAVASNNLASELLEAPSRTDAEASLMRTAAAAAHEFWLKAGNWLNDARADYLEALVANVMGEPGAALVHIDRALALIAENGGAAIDEPFLRLARAHALRLSGDDAGAVAELAITDDDAYGWDDNGLLGWYAGERSRMMPDAAPMDAERSDDSEDDSFG
jgi:hypothetical protein